MKVSILLISYNNAQFLNKVIDSILGQTFKDFELLILDNGSKDNSLEILQKYEKQDSRIRIYTESKNLGSSGSWNYLLPKASGEYIKIFASDDLMHKDYLAKTVSILNNDKNIDFVFTEIQIIDPEYKEVPNFIQKINIHKDRYEYLRYGFYDGNPFLTPTFIGKKSMFTDTIFDRYRHYFGDYTTWLRLMINGGNPFVLSECLIYSIKSPHNATNFTNQNNRAMFSFDLNHYLDVFCEIKTIEELETILPESIAYTSKISKSDTDLIPFIISMIAFQHKAVRQFRPFSESHTIFALNKIKQILTDKQMAKKIEDKFDFNGFNFIRMTTEYPIASQNQQIAASEPKIENNCSSPHPSPSPKKTKKRIRDRILKEAHRFFKRIKCL